MRSLLWKITPTTRRCTVTCNASIFKVSVFVCVYVSWYMHLCTTLLVDQSVCTCVSTGMSACLYVYRGRIWDVTVYRLVVGVIFIIDSSSGCSPMAGCKPNQCYNILTLYGYLVPHTCNTTIPHTTPTHTQHFTELRIHIGRYRTTDGDIRIGIVCWGCVF